MDEPNRLVALVSQVHYLYGFLISLGSLPFTLQLMRLQRLPVVFGIRLFGDGFIERLGGLEAIMISAWCSIAVSALDILAGYWLGKGMRLGGIFALALLPLNAFFAFGFNAPAPILLNIVKLSLLLAAWRYLV